jgi:hypothetical protein
MESHGTLTILIQVILAMKHGLRSENQGASGLEYEIEKMG